MNTFTDRVTRVLGVLLVVLSVAVSIPLTLRTWMEQGGPWGFGIVSLPVLLPLSFLILFGIAALPAQWVRRREYFIGAHLVSLVVGITSFLMFPVYPALLMVIPVALASIGIVSKRYLRFFLLLMIVLPIIANLLLFKWEVDFGRTLPLLQFFESTTSRLQHVVLI